MLGLTVVSLKLSISEDPLRVIWFSGNADEPLKLAVGPRSVGPNKIPNANAAKVGTAYCN
jgi:hypothetical protein